MAPVFPIEIFEHIIDCVWEDDSDRRVRRRVLLACSITCRSFLFRSRYYLFRDISLRNHGQLYRFASLISSVPFIDSLVRELEISDAQVLRTFALMLARRLTSVERLHLTGRNQQLLALLRADSLRPIPEFTSITKMQIFRTTFGSLADFGRLICALPNLSSLACVDVWWTKSHYNPTQFATRGCRVRLHSLEIELCPMTEMLGWFLSVTSMSNLERLILPFASQHDMEPISRLLENSRHSLRHFTVAFSDPATVATELSSQASVDRFLSLYRNAALKSIRFNLFRSQDWSWIYAILSQVAPGVEQVVFDVQSLTEGSGLNPLQFAPIDKLLQQRRLAQIQLIVTYLDDYRSSTQHVAEDHWIFAELSRCLPLSFSRHSVSFKPYKDREGRYEVV